MSTDLINPETGLHPSIYLETAKIAQGTILQADVDLAKRIAEVLEQHYPNHAWSVWVDSDQGVAVVKNLMLSFKYGFVMKLKALNSDPTLKQVVTAGGELLERWNILRSGFKPELFAGIGRWTPPQT